MTMSGPWVGAVSAHDDDHPRATSRDPRAAHAEAEDSEVEAAVEGSLGQKWAIIGHLLLRSERVVCVECNSIADGRAFITLIGI